MSILDADPQPLFLPIQEEEEEDPHQGLIMELRRRQLFVHRALGMQLAARTFEACKRLKITPRIHAQNRELTKTTLTSAPTRDQILKAIVLPSAIQIQEWNIHDRRPQLKYDDIVRFLIEGALWRLEDATMNAFSFSTLRIDVTRSIDALGFPVHLHHASMKRSEMDGIADTCVAYMLLSGLTLERRERVKLPSTRIKLEFSWI
jgi:hypothetical protein